MVAFVTAHLVANLGRDGDAIVFKRRHGHSQRIDLKPIAIGEQDDGQWRDLIVTAALIFWLIASAGANNQAPVALVRLALSRCSWLNG